MGGNFHQKNHMSIVIFLKIEGCELYSSCQLSVPLAWLSSPKCLLKPISAYGLLSLARYGSARPSTDWLCFHCYPMNVGKNMGISEKQSCLKSAFLILLEGHLEIYHYEVKCNHVPLLFGIGHALFCHFTCTPPGQLVSLPHT